MRRRLLRATTIVLALTVTALSAQAGDGILWEEDLPAGLLRAAREGRPVLLAVNALDNEGANNRLAGVLYPSAAWGDATEEWVAFVANPNGHGTPCSRYGRIACETHQRILRYVIRRFAPGGELISPHHLILDPDGLLRWRKAYYTGVVGPKLFEHWLPRISPVLSLDRASRLRADRIDALGELPLEEVTEAARAWLRSEDPLAASGVLCALDYCLDDDRRVATIRAFDAVRAEHLDVPWTAAYDAAVDPGNNPALTQAWIEAMLVADHAVGIDLAARASVASGGTYRRFVTSAGTPDEKRLRAEMSLLLSGRAKGKVDAGSTPEARRARYLQRKLGRSLSDAELTNLLRKDGAPARLRQALLWMSPDQARQHEVRLRTLFRESALERIRIAAALAMLSGRLDEAGRVPTTIAKAVFDPVEGLETRAEAAARLGEDAGWNEASWLEALRAHVGSAK